MSRRTTNTIIDEYLLLKKKVAKCVVKSKQNDKAILTNRKTLTKARKYIRRMLEIEDECKRYGWPHPDTFDPSYFDPMMNTNRHPLKQPTDTKAVMKPDGTLPNSKIEALPIAEPAPLRGMATEGFVIDDKIRSAANPDGTLFETPKLEGSFLKRRSETD